MSRKAFTAEYRGMVMAGVALVALAALLALWLIPWGGGGENSPVPQQGGELAAGETAFQEGKNTAQEEGASEGVLDEGSEDAGIQPGQDEGDAGEVSGAATGEDFSNATPTRRYVTETQRHQNFLAAVAAGQVRRMDFISTDYQPASDPNSSYITFSLITSDGDRSTGMMVMKQESGMWRISAVKQLSGTLGGGTNYLVPAGFEEVLAAELQEHQPFFSKLAQGRVSALIVDEDQHPSETETVLIGRVVGRSGRTENTVMYLRKDYNLWHLTGFDYR